MTGDELLLPRICTKVRDHVTVEWYFDYVAEVLERPSQFIRLVVLGLDGDSRVVTYTKLLSEQSHTLLTSLQQHTEAIIWVGVLLDAAPSDYTQAACAFATSEDLDAADAAVSRTAKHVVVVMHAATQASVATNVVRVLEMS